MDLRVLSYFVTVYETGSFSAASKACFVAQPSISAAIKQLETELDKQLFIRQPRGVTNTDAGQQLYPLARQLLGQAEAIRDVFNSDTDKFPFRLGLTKGLGVIRMSELLKRFTSAVDNVDLSLVPPDEPCDARIVTLDEIDPGEKRIALWEEQFQLAMPLGHPLQLQDAVSIEALHDLPLIQRSPCEGWQALQRHMSQQGVIPDIRARIQTIEYAIGLVNAGLGCAFIPTPDNRAIPSDLVFKPIKELKLSRHICLAYRQDNDIVTALMSVLDVSQRTQKRGA